MRREYEMTQADLDGMMARIMAARSAPLIMLQCGPPPSVQQVANDAWAELGGRMGFDPMTVQPVPMAGMRFFTAEPRPGLGDQAHYGDPCVQCGTPHDQVVPGPCPALAVA